MADEVVMTVRVPRSLAERARRVARSRDETLSQVIRRELRGYVGSNSNQHEGGEAS